MAARRVRVWLAAGITGTAAVNAGNIVLGAAAGVLVARVLGPAARGELVIASVGPLVVANIMDLGVDESVVYLLARAKGPAEAGSVMGSLVAMGATLGLIAAVVAGLLQWLYFAPRLHLVGQLPAYVFATLPIAYIPTQVMFGTMRARQQYALWNVCRAFVPSAYLLMVVALTVLHR